MLTSARPGLPDGALISPGLEAPVNRRWIANGGGGLVMFWALSLAADRLRVCEASFGFAIWNYERQTKAAERVTAP